MAAALDPERLAVVQRTGLLDAGIQETLQRFTRLATELTGAPVSAVSIVDASRQYFSAAEGIGAPETPLEQSYCRYVVADGEQLCVSDTLEDPVLAESVKDHGVRAYLGSPVSASGARVGAFCVADTAPHSWDDRARRVVEGLAAAVSAEIELRVLAAQQREAARLDSLTGLGNRRALAEAIETAISGQGKLFLGMLDLDGFKVYNDTFGHPAGDDLLVRLGRRLKAATAGSGCAYRMGGDEFSVIVDSADAIGAAQAALVECGPAFSVTCSVGQVELPEEASDATTAIGIAERRLYGQKRSRPGSVDQQLSAALSAALGERDGELGGHSDHVAMLARQVAETMGMGREEIRQIHLAARLHDIGKMAISDRILNKTGPLDEDEWAQMRCHTMIGERILAAAPALAGAAALVRSSHERWDGHGYPDGLRGEDIPRGARIIFACDAYDAMRSERPYRQALTRGRAIEELKRCAGSQFDPRVVDALVSLEMAQTA